MFFKNMRQLLAFGLVFLFLSAGVLAENNVKATEWEEIDWDLLVPEDFRADAILDKYGDISELTDDDPRVQKMMQELAEETVQSLKADGFI